MQLTNPKQHTMEKLKLYVRTPLNGNEFKVCNELTDEVVAIFFNQQDAVNYATTPILPSELLKQRNELLEALRVMLDGSNAPEWKKEMALKTIKNATNA
jgi:hypothetical protein